MVSYTYQHGKTPLARAARFSYGGRASEPARRRRGPAHHSQRGEPADTRPRSAARLPAVRTAGTSRRAESCRRSAVAEHAVSVVAPRGGRAGGDGSGNRLDSRTARDGVAVVRAPLAVA